MNKEIELKPCREAFEEWLNDNCIRKPYIRHQEMYASDIMSGAWLAWKYLYTDKAQLQAENVRLRGALQFYAKLENYMAELKAPPVCFDFKHTPIHMDCGERANAALQHNES